MFNLYYLLGKVYGFLCLLFIILRFLLFILSILNLARLKKTYISVSVFSPIPPDCGCFLCFRNIYFKIIALAKLYISLTKSPAKLIEVLIAIMRLLRGIQ